MKNYQQESSTVMSWLAGGWHGVKCGYAGGLAKVRPFCAQWHNIYCRNNEQ